MNIFGENLRGARIAAGLTQEALAQRRGVVKQTIGNYERGEREPDLATLRTIAGALGVALANLLDDSPATQPIKGGITMNHITLNELLLVVSARRLDVTVTLTRTLTATIQVDSNDLGQWDEISHLYGDFAVREISLTGDALAVSITPPTRVNLSKGGE